MACVTGYFSYNAYMASKKSVELGPIKLEASNAEDKNNAMLLGATCLIMFISGIYLVAKK